MSITITVPGNPHSAGDTGHTTDHNTIVTALTTLGNDAANTAGDTFTGAVTMTSGLNVSSGTVKDSFGNRLASGLVDVTTRTVTQASETQLSGSFTIPANDAGVGTVYRLVASGVGVWGSTQQTLQFVMAVNGSNVSPGGGNGRLAATVFSASLGIAWRMVGELTIITTGSGGTSRTVLDGCVTGQVGGITPGTASVNTVPIVTDTAGSTVAINTTVSNTFRLDCIWGSTTGAPTITCYRSYMERIGP